jgi:hypothetical protein
MIRDHRPSRIAAATATFAALVLLTLGSRTAEAQIAAGETPPGDVGLAISLNGPKDVNAQPQCDALGLPCSASGKTAPDVGWALLGARYFTERFGVAGEVGLFHNVWDSAASVHTSHREDNVVHFLMAGPRVSSAFHASGGPRPSDARYFGQVLIGVAGGDVVIGGMAIQPGAGMDIRFLSGVTMRLQLDYTYVPSAGRSISGPRALFALVVGIGSRL